jgi:hypothetical protein
MSVLIQGYQLRVSEFGLQIIKGPLALPQNTTSTLATVTGGSVMVTSMMGLVTTVLGATATSLSLGTAPTIGTASSSGIASATAITSKEAGTWVTPIVNAGTGGALTVGTNGGAAVFLTTPFIVAAGTITWTTGASDTGQMKWYFTYVPLDIGASLS